MRSSLSCLPGVSKPSGGWTVGCCSRKCAAVFGLLAREMWRSRSTKPNEYDEQATRPVRQTGNMRFKKKLWLESDDLSQNVTVPNMAPRPQRERIHCPTGDPWLQDYIEKESTAQPTTHGTKTTERERENKQRLLQHLGPIHSRTSSVWLIASSTSSVRRVPQLPDVRTPICCVHLFQ